MSAAPAPTSTTALAAAWSLGSLKPIEPNQRAVPSRDRPWRTPWATSVPPIAARSTRLATSLPLTGGPPSSSLPNPLKPLYDMTYSPLKAAEFSGCLHSTGAHSARSRHHRRVPHRHRHLLQG